MRSEGYSDAEQPLAAAGQLAQRYQAGLIGIEELAQQERLTAAADASCYQRAGLAAANAEATERAQQLTAAEQPDLSQRLHEARDAALARAYNTLDEE